MESGQRESQMLDPGDEPGLRKLARAVIVGALKDLGAGSSLDKERVSRWIHTEQFVGMCSLLGWSAAWVAEVFQRIDELEGKARRGVSDQCVHMLKYVP